MSRIAIIDLGTNTFNLLIASVNPDKTYTTLFQTKISVKLGEGGIGKGFIAPEAFQRGIEAIKTYRQTIEKYNVKKTIAIATSAIRGASNGAEFVLKIRAETDIDVQIISGEKEAELIYFGVRQAVKMNDETSLIIDIGGGSTEFVIANGHQIFWKHSFLLGAARLLELFNPSDPITNVQVESLNNHLNTELQPLFDAVKKYPVSELIGSSGSFDSLADMIAARYYTPTILDGKTEFTYHLEDIKAIHNLILKSTKDERLQMKGLIEMRVDMIVVSSILVDFIIRNFAIRKMRLSTYSLKEGVMYESLKFKV
jgi:exopolyphosphatase / guanosine-5'-triphosphate,3'-diphosphate pyrophosphatase